MPLFRRYLLLPTVYKLELGMAHACANFAHNVVGQGEECVLEPLVVGNDRTREEEDDASELPLSAERECEACAKVRNLRNLRSREDRSWEVGDVVVPFTLQRLPNSARDANIAWVLKMKRCTVEVCREVVRGKE